MPSPTLAGAVIPDARHSGAGRRRRGEPQGAALRFPFCTPPTARQGRPGSHPPPGRRPRVPTQPGPCEAGVMHTSSPTRSRRRAREAAGLLPLPKGRPHHRPGPAPGPAAEASTPRKPARVPAQAPAPAAEDRAGPTSTSASPTGSPPPSRPGPASGRCPGIPARTGQRRVLPVNAATGKPYRGINTVVLWATAQAEGYPSAVWATYRQWAELGAQVRKGEQCQPRGVLEGQRPGRRRGWRQQ